MQADLAHLSTPSARTFRVHGWLCLLAVICSAWTSQARAQTSAPSADVPFVPVAPRLDGVISTEEWDVAVPLDDFRMYRPTPDASPRFSTDARVMRDARHLYVAVRVGVPEEDLSAPVSARDTYPYGDHVEVQLDPWGAGQRGYGFVVTPSSVLRDTSIGAGDDSDDRSWDSLFDARAHIGEAEWTAEFAIPFQSFRFDPTRDEWAMHVFVRGWHERQTLSWAPIDPDSNNRLSQAGRIRGMAGAEAGRSLEVLPSLTASWEQSGEGGAPPCDWGAEIGSFTACGSALDYGLGVKWAMTPTLTADAVFHPDFSQVEADPGQLSVNNRFALYLNERRPFFLEGADVFDLPFDLVYTRSIGRPEFALKLSGTQSRHRIGLLLALDGEPPDSVADDGFSPSTEAVPMRVWNLAGRVTHDVGSRATLGVLAVDREYVGDGERRAYSALAGGDVEARLTERFTLSGLFVGSASRSLDGRELEGLAARAGAVWKQDDFRFKSFWSWIAEEFRAETGFLPRLGYHELFAKVDLYRRRDRGALRYVSPGLWVDSYLSPSGDETERTIGANTWAEFPAHTWGFVWVERYGEQVGARWLEGTSGGIEAGANPVRWFDLSAGVSGGERIIRDADLLGDRAEFIGWEVAPWAHLVLRPWPSLDIIASTQERRLYSEAGGERLSTEPIHRGEVQYFFSRAVSLRGVTEWDVRGESFSNDLLFSYTPSPGTVVFAGYREQTLLAPERALDARSVFVKLSVREGF